METWPDYSERFRDFLKDVGHYLLSRIVVMPLATHGDHFNHPFDKEMYDKLGESDDGLDQRTGPEFYDRQGYPIDLEALHKAEPLMHLMDDYKDG